MPLKIAKYCAVPGCGRTQSLHNLPSDSNNRNAWLNFFNEVSAHVSKALSICSLHFTADSFVNKTQVDTGFAERLRLKSNAVPSILDLTGMYKIIKKASS
uniref:THAP-type domain-containing protein n=1 Tax=Sinocyclocheilus anshuiensis TaxID=1608454 RepID=A0A671QGZ6_9TELE